MAFTGQLGTPDSMYANLEFGGPVPLAEIPALPKVLLGINWDDNPSIEFPPTGYTDVSNRVRGFSTRRGRNNFVDRVEAGTGSILLDNRDGYFNFTQAGRLLMRRVRLRAFYDNTYFPLLTGHIESYKYVYPGVDHDAVCEIMISDGLKVLAQQAFPTTYTRENEAPSARVISALTTAGIGASYQSVVNVGTTEVAPISYSGTELTQARSATISNTSAAVTVGSTVGLRVGMPVTGTGVPQGAEIQSIDSSTQFTMTTAAYKIGR